MGKSFRLGSVAGITLQIHWSFSLLIVWVVASALLAGQSMAAAASSVAFVLVLFACVALHEFGHAFAAKVYGITTRDITLLPIGGVARLERIPREPYQELVVALAGPAVNVVIAGILFLLLAPATIISDFFTLPPGGASFLQRLMFVNIALVVFNLLPAFPMDGGRVLRALLATRLDYTAATRWAALVGQVCAVGLGLLSFYNPMLLIISAFIFFAATTEANHVAMRGQLTGVLVRDAMTRNFRSVSVNAPLRDSVLEMLETPQQLFPVISRGHLVGMLHVDDALEALENRTANTLGGVKREAVKPVKEDDALLTVFEAANARTRTLPVVRDGELTGLLDLRRVLELIEARSRVRQARPKRIVDAEIVPEFS